VTGETDDQLAPRARRVYRLAEAAGFGLCGIAPAIASDHAGWLRQWLAEGKHGEMDYLADRVEQRLDPRRLLPGAQAVIAVADAYLDHLSSDEPGETVDPAERHDAQVARASEPTGRISRYAQGKDYHKTIKKRLHRVADDLREHFPDASFKCTCDTAPILEREHAKRAGLGWIGKHTLMLHPTHGSFFFLGCIVTDLPLQTSAEANYPGELVPPTDHCGTCTRCIDACPTQCIDDPDETGHRSIDASRCISYLTIEHGSTIDPALHEAMGDWLGGCDVCQDVCPFNGKPLASADAAPHAEPLPIPDESASSRSATGLPVHPRHHARWPRRWSLIEVLDWDEPEYQHQLAGNALKRIKLGMWKRNALIAAGNHLVTRHDARLQARVEQLANDPHEPPLVRETAAQVQRRLEQRGASP